MFLQDSCILLERNRFVLQDEEKGEKRRMKVRYEWKRIVAMVMAVLLLMGSVPIDAYAMKNVDWDGNNTASVSQGAEPVQSISVDELVTWKNGGVERLEDDVIGRIGQESVLYLNLDLSGIEVEDGETIREVTLNLTASDTDSCRDMTNLTARDLTGHVVVSGGAASPVIEEESVIGEELPESLADWKALSTKEVPVVFEGIAVKKGETVEQDVTDYIAQAILSGKRGLTLAIYGTKETDYSTNSQTLDLTEISLSVAVMSSDVMLNVIPEAAQEAGEPLVIDVNNIVTMRFTSYNNKNSFEQMSSYLGLIGRDRVMYFELDLSNVKVGAGEFISDAKLNLTNKGEARNVIIRDLTGFVEIDDPTKAPTIIDTTTTIENLPFTFEQWNNIDSGKVATIGDTEIPKGESTINLTNYIAKMISEETTTCTLAIYGKGADYSGNDEGYNPSKPTVSVEKISFSVMIMDSAKVPEDALDKLEEYLKAQYGDNLKSILNEIKLPDNINEILELDEKVVLGWTQTAQGDGTITYTAEATYEGVKKQREFNFTLDALELKPSILTIRFYTDQSLETPFDPPRILEGKWVLRTDLVTFLSFDLKELLKIQGEKYVEEALFQVNGGVTSGGLSNTLSVICMEEAIEDKSALPTVKLQSGNSELLSLGNFKQIAGTKILEGQVFSQKFDRVNKLELSESIYQAVRDGKERITFLLISDEIIGRAGCDLNPSTAVLNISLKEYTDELLCDEAIEILKEKYEDCYISQNVDLMNSFQNGKVNITWKSSDPSILSTNGTIGSGLVGMNDVTMTATVSCGAVSKEVALTFHVCDAKNIEVYRALEELKQKMDYLQNTTISKDVELPVLFGDSVTVTWESDKPEFIDTTGKVTRPKTGEPAAEVVLTAHIVLNADSSVSVDYPLNLTVSAIEDSDNAAGIAEKYLDLLKKAYNGSVVMGSYTLPSKMDPDEKEKVTIQIAWNVKEASEYYQIGELTAEGEYPVTVSQPKQSEKVILHCKVSVTGLNHTEYTAVREADFTVTVAAAQEESPYGRDSLQYMVDFGKSLYDEISGGERILSTTQKDGDENDIYDVQNSYDLTLGCEIEKLIAEEKFPFLYYPYSSDGDSITAYKRMQIAGTGNTTASTAGALDAAKAQAFLEALQAGETALLSRDAQTEKYKVLLNDILTTGTELLQSAHIDNTKIVEQISTGGNGKVARENLLVFSAARKNLLLKVWEAKTTLYQDAKMYLLSDKRALVEQIQISENALSGTYSYPQNNYREFRTRRDDEVLIFCLSHAVRFRNYDSTVYGLEPVLSYYKDQAIIAGSFYEMTIPVSEALSVQELTDTSKTTCAPNSILRVRLDTGCNQFALLKFDLSSIQGEVQFASLQLTNASNNTYGEQVILESEDDWKGSDAYSKLETAHGRNADGWIAWNKEDVITNFSPLGLGKRFSISVTNAVVKEKAKDNVISFRIQGADLRANPVAYVGTESTEYSSDDWPMLKVTVGIIDNSLLEQNQKKILDSKKEFLDSISIADIGSYGSYFYSNAEVGDYPSDLYENARDAYQAAEDASSVYEKAETLVQLCDAVRILKDHQILATDVDPEANLFFSSAEMEALKDRIASSQELSEKYQEIKTLADAVSLSELQSLREAIFTSDTNAIDGLGVLNFSTIGSGSSAKTIKTAEMKTVGGASAADVAYAEFVVRLSDGNYQGNGVDNGYFAYVDSFSLKDAASNVVDLGNSDFARNADGWRFVGIDTSYQSAGDQAVVGSFGEWTETTASRSTTGCLYIENQAANSNGAWVSDRFAIQTGSYSLSYQVKQHVVFKGEGVTLVVRYYDKDKNYIGYSTNYGENFKSAASFGAWSSRFQADALVYAITGDPTYAEKSILEMILGSNDFAQGSEYWMIYSNRPYGIDAYGAVQGGRFVNALSTAYSIVRTYEGWNEEDRQLLADLARSITGDLNDIRDRSEMTAAEAAYGTTNWNMDMAIGSAMLGLSLDGLQGWEYGRQYYNNGYATVLGQCTEMNIYGQDGAWNESIRYHNAAISKICVFAKSIRNMVGVNWFAKDADVQLGKSLFYNVLLQTPAYAYSDSARYISTPVYGDHVLSNGSEFGYVGLYYDEVAKVNPIQAYSMYQTWKKAGSPLPALSGDANMMESFFAPLEFFVSWLTEEGYTLAEAEKTYQSFGSTDTGSMGVDADLDGIVTEEDNQNVMDYWEEQRKAAGADSSNEYKSHGILIFRNHFNEEDKESYLSMIANECKVEHNHNDQLGIQLFANSTPLVLDVGIGGYWDLSKLTYSLSSAHGLTQFVNANGSEQSTLNAAKDIPAAAQLDFYASKKYDFMSAQTWRTSSHTDGTITRSIGYVKNGLEAYIIWDQVEEEPENMRAQYNLPLYAQETPAVDYENNRITMKGFHDTNLDILFLEGNLTEASTSIDTIMLPTNYMVAKRDPKDSAATVDLLHVKSEQANQDFLTVLFPSDAGSKQHLEAEKIEVSTEGVQVYQLTYTDGTEMQVVYVITNAAKKAATVSLPEVTTELMNLKEASKGIVNTASIQVGANAMVVLGKYEEEILDCEHTNTERRGSKEATCEEEGYTGDLYCIDCGKMVQESGTVIEALGHDYTSEVTKEPTKEEEGIRTYTCSRCKKTYEESIDKLTDSDPDDPNVPDNPNIPDNPDTPDNPSRNTPVETIQSALENLKETVTAESTLEARKEAVETVVGVIEETLKKIDLPTDPTAKEFLESLKKLEDYVAELRGSEGEVKLNPDKNSQNIEIDYKEFSVPLDKSGEIRIKKQNDKPKELTTEEIKKKKLDQFVTFDFELWFGEKNKNSSWEKYSKPFPVPMLVTIPLPSEINQNKPIVVYHIVNNRLEKVAHWNTGKNKISFMADSFSDYVIANEMTSEVVPKPDYEDEDDDSESIWGIQTRATGKVFLKADGTIAKNEWIKYQNDWYYAGPNGMLKTGWLQTSDGKWYYLSKDCTMATGWEYVNGKWYYLNSVNGDMAEGWKLVSGKWYYLNPVSGDMAEGWKLVSGKWYYLNPVSGDMAEGWKLVSGKWYYLNPVSGDMAVGWKQIKGKWYYLTSQGDCLLDCVTPDGYTVDKDGVWIQ